MLSMALRSLVLIITTTASHVKLIVFQALLQAVHV